MKQKISQNLGADFGKHKPFFSETEIKAFKTIGGFILATIAIGGTITLAAVAPNVIGAIGKLAIPKMRGKSFTKSERSKKAARAFYYLKQSGLIEIKKTPHEIWLSLTPKGMKKAKGLNFEILRIKPKAQWDGRWWLVAADIPTKHYKTSADLFRRKLKEMGFWSLQRTLWLYPYDPRTEIQFLLEHFHIEQFVTMMEINRLDKEDEKVLKHHFASIGIL